MHCPTEGPILDQAARVPILGYADDFLLLADSPAGLQRLTDAATAFCDMVGMIICIVNQGRSFHAAADAASSLVLQRAVTAAST